MALAMNKIILSCCDRVIWFDRPGLGVFEQRWSGMARESLVSIRAGLTTEERSYTTVLFMNHRTEWYYIGTRMERE